MNRRAFFTALAAPFLARFAPKSPKVGPRWVGVDLASGPDVTAISLKELDGYVHQYIIPTCTDRIFDPSRLRGLQEWIETSPVSGGSAISRAIWDGGEDARA